MRPALPDLYSQEQEQDPMVYVRFHTRDDAYQWFLTEFSQKDQDTCFGYVVSADGCKLDYFSLSYLQKRDMPLEQVSLDERILYQSDETLPEVVRDRDFTPSRWSICKQTFDC
jgi:hypothetical protein